MTVKKGDRVQHRAWHWMGTILEVPEHVSHICTVVLRRDGSKKKEKHAVFSLITDPEQFLYDWSGEDEAIKVRPKSKSKKPKRKRRSVPH